MTVVVYVMKQEKFPRQLVFSTERKMNRYIEEERKSNENFWYTYGQYVIDDAAIADLCSYCHDEIEYGDDIHRYGLQFCSHSCRQVYKSEAIGYYRTHNQSKEKSS